MYGQGMDAEGYLRRFIDFDFMLPTPEPGSFCRAQFVRFGLEEIFKKRTGDAIRYDQRNLSEAFKAFFTGFDLALREQEHCFAMLSLAPRTTKENYQIFPFLLSILIVLEIKNHQLYSDFVVGRVNYEKIINYIHSTPSGKNFLQDNYGLALEIQLAACQAQDKRLGDLVPIYERRAKDNDIEQSERDRAAEIVEMIKQSHYYSFRGVEGCLGYLVQKIDLVSRFET
jgi:hypothetical protein